jgi:hypothetical protein
MELKHLSFLPDSLASKLKYSGSELKSFSLKLKIQRYMRKHWHNIAHKGSRTPGRMSVLLKIEQKLPVMSHYREEMRLPPVGAVV